MFTFDDALRTCDRLTTYRQICAQVAREFNLIACFMAKPFMGVSASGCHHNLSLWQGGEEVVKSFSMESLPGLEENFTYLKGGNNTFLPVSGAKWMPGPIGLNCIGGVIEHLEALTAIGSSTVNSYRRLWDTGLWAPVYASWGYQNRTCALRISAPGRFEYRSVDSMVNPYLMAAALVKAFDDGIKRNLNPSEPEQRNLYEVMEAGKRGPRNLLKRACPSFVGSVESSSRVLFKGQARLSRFMLGVKKLPMSLGEALDCLATDEVIQSALPGDMYMLYSAYKRDEWERFMATTSNWDLETYLDCLP